MHWADGVDFVEVSARSLGVVSGFALLHSYTPFCPPPTPQALAGESPMAVPLPRASWCQRSLD